MKVTVTVDAEALGLSDDQVRRAVESGTRYGLALYVNGPMYKDESIDRETRRERSRVTWRRVRAAVTVE